MRFIKGLALIAVALRIVATFASGFDCSSFTAPDGPTK
jgi:hypothetical protein